MGVPLARWSHRELAKEAITRHVVDSVSVSTVRRWLHADAIKPWQCRSWIFPRDPAFAVKAARVLDLYDRVWDGQPLAADEFVISVDEKSQLQALSRRHPDLPPAPGRIRREEFEYRRGGTLAYFAAYDVHQGRILGRCAPKTGIEPFAALVDDVMSRSLTPQPRECSGSLTTAHHATGPAPSTACMTRGRPRNSSTCPSTRPGSTRSRSSSPSSRAKSSNPRLQGSRRARGTTPGLPKPLQQNVNPVQLALRSQITRRTPRTPRHPRKPQPRTPDELRNISAGRDQRASRISAMMG